MPLNCMPLSPGAAACKDEEFGGGSMSEKEFRFRLNQVIHSFIGLRLLAEPAGLEERQTAASDSVLFTGWLHD